VYRPVARRNLWRGRHESTWDVLILDEGHKIKNHNTQQYKALLEIKSCMRIIITGTPVQNNLLEYHSLLNFCAPGLLGERRAFKERFANGIELGQVCSVDALKGLPFESQSMACKF
jgi:SNF2 family DNA or RNA helicase